MPLCCSLPPIPRPLLARKPLAAVSSSSLSCLSTTSLVPISSTTQSNLAIQSLCKQGNLDQALDALSVEPHPSHATYVALIDACARRRAVRHAHQVHLRVSRDGFDQDSLICTMLVEMYSGFGDLVKARKVFAGMRAKTVIIWNALLRALALAGEGREALELCTKMVRSGLAFNRFTFSFALKACVGPASSRSYVQALRKVQEIHCHMLRRGFESVVHAVTTLVDSYSKLSRLDCAQKVFDRMRERNVVSWSAMIACYANCERATDALELFREMVVDHGDVVQPNSVTMVSVLQACADLGALDQGKLVHAYILRRGLDSVLSVDNALMLMYIKCCRVKVGRRIFELMGSRKDVVSWNSMISGLGIHGLGKESVELFREMIRSGVPPSSLTFVGVLSACSHMGLVQEGRDIFNSMVSTYGITPRPEHYSCLVDLLGRAGLLDEAYSVVMKMRIEPGPTVWGSLLGACRIHGNVELAERACQHLLELEPTNAGNYVLLADIYADAGMFERSEMVKQLLQVGSYRKTPGCSWIEVRKKVHLFFSHDETHPQIEQLNALLVQLVTEMENNGYGLHAKGGLNDPLQEEREHSLLGHSEKLAIAFGLINLSRREVIRVTNNLRVCEDCHSVTKFISKFTNREIFIKDVNRVHQFKDGLCSCGDSW